MHASYQQVGGGCTHTQCTQRRHSRGGHTRTRTRTHSAHTRTRTHAHTHTHARAHTHTHARAHTHTRTHTRTHACAHTHARAHTQRARLQSRHDCDVGLLEAVARHVQHQSIGEAVRAASRALRTGREKGNGKDKQEATEPRARLPKWDGTVVRWMSDGCRVVNCTQTLRHVVLRCTVLHRLALLATRCVATRCVATRCAASQPADALLREVESVGGLNGLARRHRVRAAGSVAL